MSLGLYIDEFEIFNPLGTSRKTKKQKMNHKVTAIYWVLADLPVRYRSALSSIYLAVLSNSDDVKNCGHEPIVEDLFT